MPPGDTGNKGQAWKIPISSLFHPLLSISLHFLLWEQRRLRRSPCSERGASLRGTPCRQPGSRASSKSRGHQRILFWWSMASVPTRCSDPCSSLLPQWKWTLDIKFIFVLMQHVSDTRLQNVHNLYPRCEWPVQTHIWRGDLLPSWWGWLRSESESKCQQLLLHLVIHGWFWCFNITFASDQIYGEEWRLRPYDGW